MGVAISAILFSMPGLVIAEPIPDVTRETPVSVPKTFESQVVLLAEKYGQNEKLARAIIHCESHSRETAYNANLTASSTIWSHDLGWWQINDYYHKSEALKRGFDITDKWDNLEYGFILMKEQGTNPWNASRHCWG